jgi:hypothetical protein
MNAIPRILLVCAGLMVSLAACGGPAPQNEPLGQYCLQIPSAGFLAEVQIGMPSLWVRCPAIFRRAGYDAVAPVIDIVRVEHGTNPYGVLVTQKVWSRRGVLPMSLVDSDEAYAWGTGGLYGGSPSARAIPVSSFPVAVGLPQGGFEVDSFVISYPTYKTYGGVNTASYIIRTAIGFDSVKGTFVGLTTAIPGSAAIYRVQPTLDTAGYRYQWYVNNTPISGATGAWISHAFPTFGSYALRVDQTTIDDSVRTTTSNISVPFTASIVGPTYATPNEAYTWTANIPFGFPPYSYTWSTGGGTLSTASSLTHSFATPASSQTIFLTIVDSQAHSVSATLSVLVAPEGCAPILH